MIITSAEIGLADHERKHLSENKLSNSIYNKIPKF